MSLLHSLLRITSKPMKRLGRGVGSGKGSHTVGRGSKGRKARTGGSVPVWFEGGQLPLIKRLPMWRGKDRFSVVRPTAEITLSLLEKMKAETITLDVLKLERVIEGKYKKAKIIATGSIKRSVIIDGLPITPAARQAIEAAGGSVK
jgi:large subunit ribosomal protein L15